MKKNNTATTAIFLAGLLLLSGCSGDQQGEANVFTASDDAITSMSEENTPQQTTTAEETTTPSVSVLEGAPEGSTTTEPEYTGEPVIDYPDGFPVPYPAAKIQDSEMLEEFKGIIVEAIQAESILHGSQATVPFSGELEGDYIAIDPTYAETKSQLTEKIQEPFASYYWANKYDESLEYLLYDDLSLGGVPRVSYQGDEEILALYRCADQPQITVDPSSSVITYLKGDYATVVALGKLDDTYYWKSYELINGYQGWVVEATSEEEISGDFALFNNELINGMDTIRQIFGECTPVYGDDGQQVREYLQIEDDPYGHGFYYGLEVEPFMTMEEMREYIRSYFTKEIAESYISLYINRSYVEKDGRLFIIEGAVLPELGEFNLENYENFTTGTFDVTSYVEWTDGENTYTLPVTIKYVDGVWKLDTRLPMKTDRIIARQ